MEEKKKLIFYTKHKVLGTIESQEITCFYDFLIQKHLCLV